MKNKPSKKATPAENRSKTGSVTREMLHARTRELALIAGSTPPQVSQADYEEAKRELTGESDPKLQEDALASTVETNSESGSTGQQIPEPVGDDEDAEGRSTSEQLAEKGVGKAENEQILQAAREAVNAEPRKP